jgi:hypothetical protein
VGLTYNFEPLKKALSQKIRLSNTPVPEICNDAAMKVLVGSGSAQGLVQLTRKATKERIKADMDKPVAGKIGSGSGRTIVRPRLFWLALQWMKQNGRTFSKEAVKEVMSAILKMRIKSRAYIAAGWLWCARDLHEKSPYLQKKHSFTRLKARNMPMVDKAEGGTAAQSFAIPAVVTGNRCVTTLYNTSRGGDTVGMEFVQQSLNNAALDVQKYVDNKVVKGFLQEMFRGNVVKVS